MFYLLPKTYLYFLVKAHFFYKLTSLIKGERGNFNVTESIP